MRIPQWATRFAAVGVNGVVRPRCARGAAANGIDPCVRVLDLAKGPGTHGLAGVLAVVLGCFVGFVEEVGKSHVEEGLELRHHPCEGYVGELLVVVTAADIGVHAGEPDLTEDLGWWLVVS